MAIQSVKYYSGTQEVNYPRQIANAEFNRLFGFVLVGKRVDSFTKWAGNIGNKLMPITRIIEYKKNPSLHKCDARCRHAKGRSCECSCGGQYHGAGG